MFFTQLQSPQPRSAPMAPVTPTEKKGNIYDNSGLVTPTAQGLETQQDERLI
jgi:hypothetical protein